MRHWNFIRCFQKNGWEITYSSPSKENSFTEILQKEGISTIKVQANSSTFDTWIQSYQPHYVIFDRFVIEEQFGWRVAENSPSSVRILDTQDLHFLRRARQAAIESGTLYDEIFHNSINLDNETSLRELASIYRSDATLMISDFEMTLLHKCFHIPLTLLQLLRFSYSPPPPLSKSYEDRKHFAMIGNFRHPPNVDAMHWLRQDIWPLVRQQLPEAEVHIYGAYAPREALKHTDEGAGFIVKGPVKDHMAMLGAHRVNLAPLRFGAGIKGKISDGWWAGTPCVSTPIGMEGMVGEGEVNDWDNGVVSSVPSSTYYDKWGGSVAWSAEEFAVKCVELYRNTNGVWERGQQNGYQTLSSLYSEERNSRRLTDFMVDIRSNIDIRRKSNRVGSILQHQLQMGLKYFSLWIQEKNNNKKAS